MRKSKWNKGLKSFSRIYKQFKSQNHSVWKQIPNPCCIKDSMCTAWWWWMSWVNKVDCYRRMQHRVTGKWVSVNAAFCMSCFLAETATTSVPTCFKKLLHMTSCELQHCNIILSDKSHHSSLTLFCCACCYFNLPWVGVRML
jgi:hypothetical protein